MGFDNPKPMGRGAFGGSMCGPVLTPSCRWPPRNLAVGRLKYRRRAFSSRSDRFSGARLPDDAEGEYVVAEYFRDGEEPVFGLMFDGGFAMSQNLPLFIPRRWAVSRGDCDYRKWSGGNCAGSCRILGRCRQVVFTSPAATCPYALALLSPANLVFQELLSCAQRQPISLKRSKIRYSFCASAWAGKPRRTGWKNSTR